PVRQRCSPWPPEEFARAAHKRNVSSTEYTEESRRQTLKATGRPLFPSLLLPSWIGSVHSVHSVVDLFLIFDFTPARVGIRAGPCRRWRGAACQGASARRPATSSLPPPGLW